jgi:hypothetical protein
MHTGRTRDLELSTQHSVKHTEQDSHLDGPASIDTALRAIDHTLTMRARIA